MKASDLYKSGQLDEAIAAAIEQVRSKPGDVPARWLLTELLCFAGDFERADKQADALMADDKAMANVAVYRQTIRAENARQQFLTDGRLPEFVAPPDEEMRLRLEASVALRAGKSDEAAELIAKADAARVPTPGVADGVAFDDFRDCDDVFAGCFEVLTPTGKYYLVPTGRVESIEFLPPKQPRDLIWRTARMVVRDGPDGEVMLPCLYAGTPAHKTDNQLRLGRATSWTETSPVRGAGLRTYLVGDEAKTIMELTSVTFGGGDA